MREQGSTARQRNDRGRSTRVLLREMRIPEAARKRAGTCRHSLEVLGFQLPALLSFYSILLLGICNCLPLHVRRMVRTASAQWFDVVHDVARTTSARLTVRGTRLLLHESGSLMPVAVSFRVSCAECQKREPEE